MNKNVKHKWVKALRSGDYKQGKGCLLNLKEGEANYCCLGVLVNLFEKEHHLQFNKQLSGWGENHGYKLPLLVSEWSGVSNSQESVLMELNDREIPFDTIACVIDQFQEGY
jgi:hypothetical protein